MDLASASAALDCACVTACLQEACAGVTTGQLLCACVGSPERAEYTVYGDAINLSARLMMKASGGLGSVLCDSTTQEFASRAATFRKLSPMKVCLSGTFSMLLQSVTCFRS